MMPGVRRGMKPKGEPRLIWSDRDTRVLLCVMGGARTYERIMQETGVGKSNLKSSLERLRAGGLVDWVRGKRSTLHATVEIVR